MSTPTPQTQPDHVPSEGVEDGAYYAKDGAVWKEPVTTLRPDGSRVISIGFKVCTMTDVVGEEAAESVAALMNAGAAATALSSSAAAGSTGEGWRPIESAPKDGRYVLLYARDRFAHEDEAAGKPVEEKVRTGYFLTETRKWTHPFSTHFPPTHWMPLPPKPTEASRSETGRGEDVDDGPLTSTEAVAYHEIGDEPSTSTEAVAHWEIEQKLPLTARPVGEDALRCAVGEPFMTANSGCEGGPHIRLRYETLAEMQRAHTALCAFFRGEPLAASEDALREALAWYGEQARLARLIHSEGDSGRHALADDGGKRARAALANTTQPAAGQGAGLAPNLGPSKQCFTYCGDGICTCQERRLLPAEIERLGQNAALTPSTSKAAETGTGYVEVHLDARQDRPDIPSNARVAPTSKAAPLSEQGDGPPKHGDLSPNKRSRLDGKLNQWCTLEEWDARYPTPKPATDAPKRNPMIVAGQARAKLCRSEDCTRGCMNWHAPHACWVKHDETTGLPPTPADDTASEGK